MVRILLKVEALFIFLVCLFFYWKLEQGWVLYALCLLVPDISMLGYFYNKRAGATIYNIFHLYIWPILLISAGFLIENNLLIGLGLIYASHISMDRLLGYGLKYSTGFRDNHLSRI